MSRRELADCLSVLVVASLVGDCYNSRNTDLPREFGAATRSFQRLEVRLKRDDQGIDMTGGPATQMLHAGLHIDYGNRRFIFQQRTDDMPHLGMSTAQSTSASVVDLTH